MSPESVHPNEMPHPIDPVFEPGGPLGFFADDARVAAGGLPPAPRPGLLALMGAGIAAPTVTPREKPMFVKSLLGSLAAKVALGVGLATATVTAAGAAGVLPAAAQHAVATAVGVATPFQLPDDTAGAPKAEVRAADEPVGSTTTSSSTSTSTSVPKATSTTIAPATTVPTGSEARPLDNHGACVSAVAHDPSLTGEDHGAAVSTVARSDCGKTPSSTSTTAVRPTTTSSTSTTLAGNAGTGKGGPNAKAGSDGNGNAGGDSPGNSGKN